MEETQKTEMLNPHSVEITKGQSGKIGFTVKSYGHSTQDALVMALKTFKDLNETYPSS